MKRIITKVVSTVVLSTLIVGTGHCRSLLEIGFKGGLGVTTISNERTGLVLSVRDMVDDGTDYRDNFAKKSRSGFVFGGFLALNLSDHMAIQAELAFSKKQAKVSGSAHLEWTIDDFVVDLDYALSEQIELSYVEIPLLVKLKLATDEHITPSVFGGPVFAFVRSGTDDIDIALRVGGDGITTVGGETDISNLKDSDFGWVFGGEVRYNVGFGEILADFRYSIGTGDLFEDVDPDDIPDIEDDTMPDEYPMASYETGKAADIKPRAFSVMLGLSFPIGRR